jgi:hypothetical protein
VRTFQESFVAARACGENLRAVNLAEKTPKEPAARAALVSCLRKNGMPEEALRNAKFQSSIDVGGNPAIAIAALRACKPRAGAEMERCLRDHGVRQKDIKSTERVQFAR